MSDRWPGREASEARTLLRRGLERTHEIVVEYRSKLVAARDALNSQCDEAKDMESRTGPEERS